MTLETKSTLTDATIDKLQDLIQINIDSVHGLTDAANAMEDSVVADLFRQIASDRRSFASELQMYVSWNGEDCCCEGESLAAKVHQTWMNLRAKLNGGDTHVVLIEAERGEDHIKEAYETALKENPGSAVSEILHSQYAVVKAGHDRIRDLRDAYADRT